MKDSFKNVYFKQLKNGRLKIINKLYLRHCGKRDARRKVIREDENGIYISPFIYHEIYLYNLALKVEEENFAHSIMSIQVDMNIFQWQIDQKEKFMTSLDYDSEMLINKKVNLEQMITILRSKKHELSLFIDEEMEIKQLRSQQLFSILQARIAAYWEGVLQVSKADSKIPPIVMINHLSQGGELFHEEK